MICRDYYSKYDVVLLSATATQKSHTFTNEAKSIKVSNASTSDTVYITLSERDNNDGRNGFDIEDVDTTQADGKTIALVAGEYMTMSLDTNKMNYKCAAGETATLQVVTLSQR